MFRRRGKDGVGEGGIDESGEGERVESETAEAVGCNAGIDLKARGRGAGRCTTRT